MQQDVSLSRAIGAEFVGRKIGSLLRTAAMIIGVLLFIALWLVQYSWWWLFLLIPMVLLAIVLVGIFWTSRTIIRIIRPSLSDDQYASVRSFVDKLNLTAERIQTPIPFIVVRVIWDVFITKKRTYLPGLIAETTDLRGDYSLLRKKFASGS